MPIAQRVPFLSSDNVDPEVVKVLDWLHQSESSTGETDWRTSAQEAYKFYAGDQDTDEVKQALQDMNRPNSTFNEVKPKVDMLCGMAAQTRYDPHVYPVSVEDGPLAELANGALKFYSKRLYLTDKHVDCFTHTVKTGRSLLHFYMDKQNPYKPEIKTKRFSGFDFSLDPNCTDVDINEHRFYFLTRWVTEEELKVFWPHIDTEIIKSHGTSGGADYPQFYNTQYDLYRICECWYKVWEKGIAFIDPMSGDSNVLTVDEYKQYLDGLELYARETGAQIPELQEVPTYLEKKKYMIFADIYVLESGYSPFKHNLYPSVLFGAYMNDWENRWFGVIEMMKDPQRAINTTRRQLLHLLQTLPKGFPIHEAGAILNIEEFEERSSDPSFHLEVAAGGIEKVRFERQPPISPIYQAYDQEMKQAMKDASGVQDELMGIQKTGREAGVTTKIRQESAIAVLYILFDNFRKSRLQSSKILMGLIQQYRTMPELVRIEGQEGMQLVQLNTQMNPQNQGFNSIKDANLDLEIDETMENTTMRMTIAQLLTEFSHNNPGSIPPDVILEYANIPFTVKQRVKAFFQAMRDQEQANIEKEHELKLLEIGAKRASERDKVKAQKETKSKKEE